MVTHRTMSNLIAGLLFLAPALLFFTLFIGEPVVATLYLSFTKYNVITPAQWIGFDNFKHLVEDQRLLLTYGNTLKYILILTPMHAILGLLLALAVNRPVASAWKYVYRTVFYFPVLATSAAVAVAWQFMFSKDFGILNYCLGLLGVDPIAWMQSPFWVYVAVAIYSFWKFIGNAFLYYLIGLQSIPATLYEAAEMDGASGMQRFSSITLPMLSPTIFFVLVTTLIGATQIFDEPYLITGGGPGDASRSVNMYIYEVAFQHHEMGYASTLSLSLFVIILCVTMVQFAISRKWVNYDRD
ncbi:carbohydrate ABC transporter permease [Paenibacillus sp. GCM10023248]|uniref:carbohydrate ABC transporter permease n=1 Tax=Bacillales TaxID=1385 RepID=UPI00237950B6|nr:MULTISPECIES: sugar ABC transporter permease [Bacillales]MDD9268985.1 sugar ABC transporter permease [Paenibacillus sp. MAHUQ-63]MDR6885015.1 multiple sugar transport system permease protein [Bacillus sp. 3255]